MGRKLTDANRLSITFPDLAKEWHPTKNGKLTPVDVSRASHKKVWWLCKKDNSHEWEAVISSRTTVGVGCPYCSGRRVSDMNRLSIRYPDIAKQWHPTRNGDLTPDDVPYGRNRKAWWLCENDHEWEAVISSRTGGRGCPDCSGKRVSDLNRLSTLYPDVAKEWHPTRNGDLTPADVSRASQKKVWWLCKNDHSHEWDAPPDHRTRGSGCPFCSGKRVSDTNRLSKHYPDVAAQWHPTKNGKLTADDVSYGSNKRPWWICEEGHEWTAVISSRTLDGSGCRVCAGQAVTDDNRLSIHCPDIAAQWHPTKNGKLTAADFARASNKKVWWRCEKGHEWCASIPSRAMYGRGCGFCSGYFPTDENRLSILYPDVAAQWHPTMNGDLTPDKVSYGSNKKIRWLCEKGHEWDAIINSRTTADRIGCPYCAGKLVSDANRMSALYPDVAAQWHPTKNGDLTPDDVSHGSDKKVWWLCENGHEWEASIGDRTRGNGCPRCVIPHRSEVEIYLACELKMFFPDIDPKQTYRIAPSKGKALKVDILIPSLNKVVEYDGCYWHEDKLEEDTNKTSVLKAAGYSVLRIREEPLPLIQPTDLQCKVTDRRKSAQLKRLANKVLTHLAETFDIPIPGLAEYLARNSLANEALALDIIGKEHAKSQNETEPPQNGAQQLPLFPIAV